MSTFETKYEIIPATPGARSKVYRAGGKEFSFKGHNAMYVSDPGIAKELTEKHGGTKNSQGDELRVIPARNFRRDGIHTYSFTMSGMGNWKERIDWSKK